MRTIIISGREMTSRANAHAHLSKKLSFPDYYGGNLDALHDCLTEINDPTHIIIEYCNDLVLSLGSYGTALLQVLNIAAQETSFLTVSFHINAESHTENKTDKDPI